MGRTRRARQNNIFLFALIPLFIPYLHSLAMRTHSHLIRTLSPPRFHILSLFTLFFLPTVLAFTLLISPTSTCGEYVLILNTSVNETLPLVVIGDTYENDTLNTSLLVWNGTAWEVQSNLSSYPFLPFLHTTPETLPSILSSLNPNFSLLQPRLTLSLTRRIGNGLADGGDTLILWLNESSTSANLTPNAFSYPPTPRGTVHAFHSNTTLFSSFSTCNLTKILINLSILLGPLQNASDEDTQNSSSLSNTSTSENTSVNDTLPGNQTNTTSSNASHTSTRTNTTEWNLSNTTLTNHSLNETNQTSECRCEDENTTQCLVTPFPSSLPETLAWLNKTLADTFSHACSPDTPFTLTLPLIRVNETLYTLNLSKRIPLCEEDPCSITIRAEAFQEGRIYYRILTHGRYSYAWYHPNGSRLTPVRISSSSRTKTFTPRLPEDSAVLTLRVTRLDCEREKEWRVGWVKPRAWREEEGEVHEAPSQSCACDKMRERVNTCTERVETPRVSFRAVGRARVDGTRRYEITCTNCTLLACNATRIQPGVHVFTHTPTILVNTTRGWEALVKPAIPKKKGEEQRMLHASSSPPARANHSARTNQSSLQEDEEARGETRRAQRASSASSLSGMLTRFAGRLKASWNLILVSMLGVILIIQAWRGV